MHEIAPFEWGTHPQDKTSLYEEILKFGRVRGGVALVTASDTRLKNLGTDRARAELLVLRWNSGERWL